MANFIHDECVQEAHKNSRPETNRNTKGSDITETPHHHSPTKTH